MKAVMVTALVMVSAAASAQISVNAGYVNTKLTTEGAKAINGITAGVGYDMNIQGGFGLAWGLNYTYGFRSDEVSGETAKTSNHTLDIPVRLTYTFPISDSFSVFGFAGPKFAYSIAGKTGDVNMYGKDGFFNPFDVKVGLGAGVNFSNILLKVGYDWGLLNAWKEYDGIQVKGVNNQFYVTVGYAL